MIHAICKSSYLEGLLHPGRRILCTYASCIQITFRDQAFRMITNAYAYERRRARWELKRKYPYVGD